MKHPIQKPILVGEVLRFTQNKIIQHMLDKLHDDLNYGLNELSVFHQTNDGDKEDWDQFMQLIGYSVSGAPIDGSIIDAAYNMHENGKSESEARADLAEEKLDFLKKELAEPIAALFELCPEDLYEE